MSGPNNIYKTSLNNVNIYTSSVVCCGNMCPVYKSAPWSKTLEPGILQPFLTSKHFLRSKQTWTSGITGYPLFKGVY